MSNAKHYEDIIRDAMARTLWVMAYANWVEDQEDVGIDEGVDREWRWLARPGGGEDWDSYTPETPIAAEQAAGALNQLIRKALGLTDKNPLGRLFEQMAAAHFGDVLVPDTEWLKQIKDASWFDRADTIMVYADWLEQHGRIWDAQYARATTRAHQGGWGLAGNVTGHEGMAKRFGDVLVHMAEGTGVDWSDDVRIKDPSQRRAFENLFNLMPRFECHYDGEDLTWEGSLRDHSAGRASGMQRARYGGPDDPTDGPTDLAPDAITSAGQRHIIIVNPNDKSWMRHSYLLWIGEGMPRYLMIYANSLDDAFDELIDWASDNAPGLLADDQVNEEYTRLRNEFIEENGHDPDDDEEMQIREQAEADTVTGGNAGNHIEPHTWGIIAEDPTDRDLLVEAGLIENPPRKKAPKQPESAYDQLATVMFRNTVTARMLRLLARRGHMTQADFMRVYMEKCERPPSAVAERYAEMARRGLTPWGPRAGGPDPDAVAVTYPSGYNNNWHLYTFNMRASAGVNYWSELSATAENRNMDRYSGTAWKKVIGRRAIQKVRRVSGTTNYEDAGASSRNELFWKGPSIEDLLKNMSPAKLQWAFENLEHQMISSPRKTDDIDGDFGWWIERIRPLLVKQNPARRPFQRVAGSRTVDEVPAVSTLRPKRTRR